MIEYYDLLNEEEQDDMRDLIQLLLRQTFLLERKYDRRAGRMVPSTGLQTGIWIS